MKPPALTTVADLIHNSKVFHQLLGYQTQHNLIQNIKADHELHASSTRVIVLKSVYQLATRFLEFKQQSGNRIEKEIYKELSPSLFISRLITKRPLAFLGSNDHTRLRNGQEFRGDTLWPLVGTEAEKEPLVMRDYLTYDEMAISSLIGVSSLTEFINPGNRNNCAIPAPKGSFIPNGIYIGLVGARFEREFMESQFCLVVPQHCAEKGYGNRSNELMNLWADFYGIQSFPMFKDAESNPHLVRIGNRFFNHREYKTRMKIAVETLLLEAEARAIEFNKSAYVHVVGLGLGVWQVCPEQRPIFVNLFGECIQELSLKHIKAIDFSFISNQGCDVSNQGCEINSNIDIIFSRRNPADVLQEKYRDCLVVATYAWDGNSFPGNEIYCGSLSGSGDPAAACCSTIYELQNPYINPFSNKIHIL